MNSVFKSLYVKAVKYDYVFVKRYQYLLLDTGYPGINWVLSKYKLTLKEGLLDDKS